MILEDELGLTMIDSDYHDYRHSSTESPIQGNRHNYSNDPLIMENHYNHINHRSKSHKSLVRFEQIVLLYYNVTTRRSENYVSEHRYCAAAA